MADDPTPTPPDRLGEAVAAWRERRASSTHDNGSEAMAVTMYLDGDATAEEIAAGYADGTIQVRAPRETPDNVWEQYLDPVAYMPYNPWRRVKERTSGDLATILAAREAVPPRRPEAFASLDPNTNDHVPAAAADAEPGPVMTPPQAPPAEPAAAANPPAPEPPA